MGKKTRKQAAEAGSPPSTRSKKNKGKAKAHKQAPPSPATEDSCSDCSDLIIHPQHESEFSSDEGDLTQQLVQLKAQKGKLEGKMR